MDQLYEHLKYGNVNVPRFHRNVDVFEFLSEFETATSGATDDQKRKLLAKSFIQSQFRPWYETDLKSDIEIGMPWSSIKSKIIERFSFDEACDRYLTRLREMKYDPSSAVTLLEFIEDLHFTYKKAYPDDFTEQNLVRFVKAAMPSEIRPKLRSISGYEEAMDAKDIKLVARKYDSMRQNVPSTVQSADTSQLTSMIKELLKGIKDEGKTTRDAIVAAMATTSVSSSQYQRQHQPRKPDHDRQSTFVQSYHRRQSPAPRERPWLKNKPSRRSTEADPNQTVPKSVDVNTSNESEFSFDTYKYFKKHGKPPAKCKHCDGWHWHRHCPLNLNE